LKSRTDSTIAESSKNVKSELKRSGKPPAPVILLVDDEESILTSLGGALEDENFKILKAKSGEEGLQTIVRESPDVVLLDIWMPGMDGLDVLRRAGEMQLNANFIIMTGHGTIETAVAATKLGAFDFIEKPISLEKLLISLRNLLDKTALARENKVLKERAIQEVEIIGVSTQIEELKEKIERVAPTNAWILVTGDNGTGKELVARGIHIHSERSRQPLVEVNCAAIPEELIESELFGHEKGAFTGATQERMGKFEIANKGTVFLDEIGDMSLNAQAKVLRLLEEQRFERVGGSKPIQVDVRVIAATNKDLESEIKKGTFREDLYYRLNVIHLQVPPLRDRKEDIPLLIDHFLKLASLEGGGKKRKISPKALELLENYYWPGNVRELRNLIEGVTILNPAGEITEDHLPKKILDFRSDLSNKTDALPSSSVSSEDSSFKLSDSFWGQFGDNLKEAKLKFEKEFIIQKLRENEWNISRTSQVINIERSNLHRKIKSFGIDV